MQTLTPVYQTFTGTGEDGSEPGNCLVASIATITGKRLTSIPHFVADYLARSEKTGDGATTVADMADYDWFMVLHDVQAWLTHNGYRSAAVEPIMHPRAVADMFGKQPIPHLALVMSTGTGEPVPHIIVTDARGIQMWDPNPLNTKPFQPSEIEAMLRVTNTATPATGNTTQTVTKRTPDQTSNNPTTRKTQP